MSEEISTETTDESETYNLVLFPNIAEGEDEDEVKDKLAKTLKVEVDKVQGWYDSEAPTILLKGVAKDVANRYMNAIIQCGAACNIQASSEGGLSLVPKSKNIDFFICPSCEYEEEVSQGTKFEQCPKCGLVIAKWEEKMKEEREKEAIRRRLMRDARLKDDREEELKRKRDELERLRKLELEIMKELGLKPPGPLWLFFEKYPVSVSGAVGILLITLSSVVHFYVDQYLREQAHQELVEAEPSSQIQQIAPLMAAAVQLQQNGNEGVMAEMAQATTVMHGQAMQTRQAIVHAAQQMMKGADQAQFIAQASKMARMPAQSLPGPQNQVPVPINRDTLGGVTGLQGMESFEPNTLKKISPPLLEHGPEEVLNVLGEKRMKPDPQNPETNIVVDEIDEMDGSMIVNLMKNLHKDQEWDQYISRNVDEFLLQGDMDSASNLIDRIENSVLKIEAFGAYMEQLLFDDPEAVLKLPMARVRLELDDIEDPDTKAKVLLELGSRLSIAGFDAEPGESISRVEEMIQDSTDLYEKSFLSSRVAVAYLMDGNKSKARQQFAAATTFAGQIQDRVQRISAFTRLAQRYYDARNVTLANEILAEAQVIAASEFEPTERSQVFGEIAIAQGYMGDLVGALTSIRNAGTGEGEQQLKAKLAESLIGLGKYFQAQAVMQEIDDRVALGRLNVRLISSIIHESNIEQARLMLASVPRDARLIDEPSMRGLVLSQLGRLAVRAGMKEEGRALFAEALGMSSLLQGRKAAVNRGMVALDQARAMLFGDSAMTMEDLTESIVRDPIGSEVTATERVYRNFMPEAVKQQLLEESGAT